MTTVPLTPATLPISAVPTIATSPLSPSQLSEFQFAHQRARKIRRAASVAQIDAWAGALFAAVTLLAGILSPASLLLGTALAFIAFNSFRGARGLKQFNPAAPRLLALNQLTLAAVILLYCVYSIWSSRHAGTELSAAVGNDPALNSMLGDLSRLYWTITLAIYGAIGVGSVITQGLTALYYITRQKHLAAYVAQTPPWILSLQKAQAGA